MSIEEEFTQRFVSSSSLSTVSSEAVSSGAGADRMEGWPLTPAEGFAEPGCRHGQESRGEAGRLRESRSRQIWWVSAITEELVLICARVLAHLLRWNRFLHYLKLCPDQSICSFSHFSARFIFLFSVQTHPTPPDNPIDIMARLRAYLRELRPQQGPSCVFPLVARKITRTTCSLSAGNQDGLPRRSNQLLENMLGDVLHVRGGH